MIVPIGSYLAGAYCIDYLDNPTLVLDEENNRLIAIENVMYISFNEEEINSIDTLEMLLEDAEVKKLYFYPNKTRIHICYDRIGKFIYGTFTINYKEQCLEIAFNDVYLKDILAIGECDDDLHNKRWFESNFRHQQDYMYYTNNQILIRVKDNLAEKLENDYTWKEVGNMTEAFKLYENLKEVSHNSLLTNLRNDLDNNLRS